MNLMHSEWLKTLRSRVYTLSIKHVVGTHYTPGTKYIGGV